MWQPEAKELQGRSPMRNVSHQTPTGGLITKSLCSPIAFKTESAGLRSPFSDLEKPSPQPPRPLGEERQMLLGQSIFLLERAGGDMQGVPHSHSCHLGDNLHWRDPGIYIPFGNVWVWCAHHKGYPDLCWSKTEQNQPGNTKHENYIQEQFFFSGKDISFLSCAGCSAWLLILLPKMKTSKRRWLPQQAKDCMVYCFVRCLNSSDFLFGFT